MGLFDVLQDLFGIGIKKKVRKPAKKKTKKASKKKTTKKLKGRTKKKIKKIIKRKPKKKTKRKITKKTSREKTKPAKKPKKKKSAVSSKKPSKKSQGKEIGVITHYFGKISVGIIKLKGKLIAGDKIYIKGAHSDFTQLISTMQLNHKEILHARKGDEIGIKVSKRVHQNDKVYKID
jgi:hypothetical protein